MRGRLLIAIMLLTASLGALVVDASISSQINPEPTGRKLSQCFSCHENGGGSFGPPMTDTYLIITPEETLVPIGEKVPLLVTVKNAWVSETDQVVAAVDLEQAPGLAHSSSRADISEVIPGEITPDLASVGGSSDEYIQRHNFSVEGGVTDLVITLTPDQTVQGLEPSLIMRLWPSSYDPNRASDPEFRFTGTKGGEVQYTISGASEIVALGVGSWTAEIAMKDVFTSADPASAANQPYTLTVEQFFRETLEPVAFNGADVVLGDIRESPGDKADIEFFLTARELPAGPGTVSITVNAREFYDHPPSASQWDQWIFTKTIELTAEPVPESNAIMIRGSGVIVVPELEEVVPWDRIGEVIGYISSFLIVASIYTGGMFGKTSRRQLNTVFGTAKRRVAFHNFLSYGILLFAIIHTVMFIWVELGFEWTRGIIWGGIAILAMVGLGVTGALQVAMIRKWNYAVWRWSHFYLAIGTMLFTVVHIFLDGANFADLQEAIGWTDPFA